MTEDRLKAILDRLPKRDARPRLDGKTLKRLYEVQGWTAREIGDFYGLDFRTVLYHLRRSGITIRPRTRVSSLRKYKAVDLERGVKEKGLRGYAQELGVHENTLRKYLRGVKSSREEPTL